MRFRKPLIALAAVAAAAAVPVGIAVGDDTGGTSTASSDAGDAFVQQARATAEDRAEPFPLTGEGENMELVANIPIDFGSDLELFGDYAYVGTYGTCTPPAPAPGGASKCVAGSGGITVIDISNPREPRQVGLFDCAGGQNDVQISPDGNWAVMAIEDRNNHCHPGLEGTVVLDISDKTNPREVSFLPINGAADAGGNTLVGSHNNTLDWPYLYIDQYVARYNRIDVFDLTDPANPEALPGISYGSPFQSRTDFTTTSPHDLIIDHRPDGRDLLYASSGNQTNDVIDVTNPRAPQILQRAIDPAVTFAHQSETNPDRSLTLVTDEYRGGGEARACGKTSTDDGPLDPTNPPPGGNTTNDRNNLGALYFYRNNADGTLQLDGSGNPIVAGTYNLPLQTGSNVNGEGCTVHIYWQAPEENRLVVSWYGKGTRVVDYSDPARPKELGHFVPTGANTWSAKPHNGYIFTGDIERGFDVLRYTGEDGARWPTTAGPAEVQRAEIQGAAAPAGAAQTASARAADDVAVRNENAAPARAAGAPKGFERALQRARKRGGSKFRRTVPVRGTAPVTLTIRNAGDTMVARQRFRVRKGQRKLTLRANVTGVSGRHRYVIRQGGRRIERGVFETVNTAYQKRRLKAGATLVCKIIRSTRD